MKLKRVFFYLCALPLFTLSVSTTLIAAKSESKNWYQNLFFKDPSLNYEFIRGLGYTYEKGADIGEAISTAQKTNPETIENWYQAWLATADRIAGLGQKYQTENNVVSAASAFLRASNYYRMASFYMDAPQNRSKAIKSWKRSQESFLSAIKAFPFITQVEIPYEKTKLHGYFIKSKNPDAPLLILNTGFDGTAEELYFVAGQAAYQRGYNVLFFDGPGQGQSIKMQHLIFRPDWEKVIAPVIQFAHQDLQLKNNKIALAGFSMGGYLAARACAFLPEIKACILDPGVYSFQQNTLQQFPKAMRELYEKTPAAFIDQQKKYQLGSWVKKLTMPVLVIDDTADNLIQGQAKKVFDAIPQPKTFHRFTPESTAEAHCQVGASAISNAVIFNWLDRVLDFKI